MTEHQRTYQETLKAARKENPEVDLVLDCTAEDVDWLRGKRRGGKDNGTKDEIRIR